MTLKQMHIIALEGLDKSGKHTQTELLKKNLQDMGNVVVKSEFHRYDTPTGSLIRDFLKGRYDVSQETIELIIAADKQAQQDWLYQMNALGVDFVILDRYTGSQKAYAEANGVDTDWIEAIINQSMPPTMEILLDLSPEESMRRKGKHGDNDKYESNYELLKRVRSIYKKNIEHQVDAAQPVEKIQAELLELITDNCLR